MTLSTASLPTGNPRHARWRGLWIPLVTPLRDGAVDHTALARLCQHLEPQGIAGWVVCGSTGEAAALDAEEQQAVLATVLSHTQRPVVMGLSGYHLPQTLAWVRELAPLPIAGWLVPAPHYIRPCQDGLRHWFESIADAAQAPLIVYDIPYRTGATLALPTLRALARHPHIEAIKDCGGDTAKTQALIEDGELAVLAGEDAQIYGTLALGGAGAIAASAHLCTADFARLVERLLAGDLATARALWARLTPLTRLCFETPNPAPVKAALAAQGWLHNELRAPLMPAGEALAQRLLACTQA